MTHSCDSITSPCIKHLAIQVIRTKVTTGDCQLSSIATKTVSMHHNTVNTSHIGGLVSIHGSRNNYTKFIKFTEDKTDIPNTISMYIKPIKTEFDIDDKNNSETKDDSNLFFQKRQQTHKIEKVQAKRVSTINSYTSYFMKATKSEKYNVLNHKLLDKKIDNKKNKKRRKN